MQVPDDDVGGRQASGDEAPGDGGDDGGPGAVEGAGLGKDLDADDVVGGDEAAPGIGDAGGAGETGEAEVEGGGDAVVVGEVGVEEFLALDDDDAGEGIGGVQGERIIGVHPRAEGNPDEACKLEPCVS